jgi:tetratricopeptide (TPR) repeat protein
MKSRVVSVVVFLAVVILLAPRVSAREPKKPVSKNPQAQALIDQSWAAQDQQMTIKEIDQSIKFLEQAVALDPQNEQLLVELADEYYQRGDQLPRGSDANFAARNKWFSKGYATAQKAMKIKESAGAHYWMAANLAAQNENAGIVTQAKMFPELKRHMDWIEAHDKNYKYGAGARFWSRVISRVPGVVVKMVGEDPNRIYGQLQQAIKSAPLFIDNYIYQAEFLHTEGKDKEALDTLDKALKMNPEAMPEERAYNRYAQKKAKAYWKEWSGKEYPNR